ncbi:flagellin N-terminal helical domain-containing protein [Lachnobacterium bovis]|uniref:Flagellin n=1 Tax=Lachnobacterium bovis DSM 14045 TaxID=1122142 RepID=A0A1H3M4E4_9FIRM|nr:flagellin [Lachnobacterium bovis]SDY71089.1 flagellin [Lachnobacterium bovis DSM 14045]
MRINHNLSAVITNNQLKKIEQNLAASTERLSTGYKINKPGDNPAGLAISFRMTSQTKGVSQARDNTSSGISVMQVADGALGEVIAVLQRMRELCVQAASDSNVYEDKLAAQSEIDKLKKEVDRIASDTQYNGKNLLDGSQDIRSYADNADRILISDDVKAGFYKYEIISAAEKAHIDVNSIDFNSDDAFGVDGNLNINGRNIELKADMTNKEVFEKIRQGAEIGEAKFSKDNGVNKLEAIEYGSDYQLDIRCSSQALADKLFANSGDFVQLEDGVVGFKTDDIANYNQYGGKDVGINLHASDDGFSGNATAYTSGNRVQITDINGFSIDFLNCIQADKLATAGEQTLEVTDIGDVTMQVGANQYQEIDVRIPRVSSEALYIEKIDVSTTNGGGRGISILDDAIAAVSKIRSGIGAAQNRLNYAANSLSELELNMTGAYSTLMDTDMAEEMTRYTEQNILNQATISVLSQANDMPQQILALLTK